MNANKIKIMDFILYNFYTLISFDEDILNNIDSYCGPEKNPDPFPNNIFLNRSVHTTENNINRKITRQQLIGVYIYHTVK